MARPGSFRALFYLKEPEAGLLQPFIDAAQELEAEGVKAITTNCGFLAAFQRVLADAVNIPVFTSALMLAPLVRTMINTNQRIGIFTERAWNMDENHFNKVGWSSRDIAVCVTGMPDGSPFPALFIDGGLQEERETLEECMVEMTARHMKEHPDTAPSFSNAPTSGPSSAAKFRTSPGFPFSASTSCWNTSPPA